MTMNKEASELPSMLIQRWRAEAAAHEKRAEELSYGYPIFADRYEKKAAQKIECAAQLESALSASAEPVASPSAVHTALRMLIAAGFVTQAKANEALRIATGFMPGPLEAPPASCNPTTQPASVPDGLIVDIFYLAPGDDTFICEVHGMATIGVLSEIEAEIKENPLDEFQTYGQGNYKLRASYFPGQYGEFGRCEIAPGYELDFIAYTPIATTPEPCT